MVNVLQRLFSTVGLPKVAVAAVLGLSSLSKYLDMYGKFGSSVKFLTTIVLDNFSAYPCCAIYTCIRAYLDT